MHDFKAGERFGRLVVEARDPRKPKRGYCRQWICVCDCGTRTIVRANYLANGTTRSCGCLWNDIRAAGAHWTHGRSGTREYNAWQEAKRRCHNPNCKSYSRYGAKGITMASEWRSNFAAFYAEVGPCPDGYSLDRIDNSRGYEPGNCRWASVEQQANNKSTNHRITFRGKTLSLSQWAHAHGLADHVLYKRLKRGWTMERALEG